MRPLTLIVVFLLAVAASLPFAEVPTIDDWAYAYSVDRFLDTGRLEVLDFVCRYNLPQTVWGSLFSWPAGVSFTALRASTLVLAIAGMLAFYDLLRRRTGDASLALWCSAVLAFNPLFFRLSMSFMTDVPLIALISVSFWIFDLGLRGRGPLWMGAALLLLAASYLVRELAVVGPPALLLAAAWDLRRRITPAMLVVLVLVGAAGLLAVYAFVSAQEVTWALHQRSQGLNHVWAVPATDYLAAVLRMQLTAAFLVAPLALATIRLGREVVPTLVIGLACGGLAFVLGAAPFGRDDVLSPLGLGLSRVLIPGGVEIGSSGSFIRGGALLIASLSLGVILGEISLVGRAAWTRLSTGATTYVEAMDVGWLSFAAGQTAALLILWLWQDRYDIVLVPSALWLLALRARTLQWRAPVVASGCAAFALVAVLGTRDDVRLNQAVWQAEEWLRHQGVPAESIDAGYVSNSWRLYAYAEHFAPGYPADDVPFLYSKRTLPYSVSTRPLPGVAVMREWSWPRTWLSEPKVYALSR